MVLLSELSEDTPKLLSKLSEDFSKEDATNKRGKI